MFDREKWLSMKRDAMSLIESDSATSAAVLVVLRALSEEEIDHVCSIMRISDQVLDAPAQRAGFSPAMFRRVITRYILPGLEDYSEYYRSVEQTFAREPSSKVAATSVFAKYGLDRRYFLLHTELSMWDGPEAALESLVIEDGHMASLCAGYLVGQQSVFQNVVELLRDSRKDEWANWRKLWAFF